MAEASAGKTTTIEIPDGYRKRTKGEVSVFDRAFKWEPQTARG
jgi:ABC-type multidrug transport system ATPase subunit